MNVGIIVVFLFEMKTLRLCHTILFFIFVFAGVLSCIATGGGAFHSRFYIIVMCTFKTER